MTAAFSRSRKSTPYNKITPTFIILGKTLSAVVIALESGPRITVCHDPSHPHWTHQALKALCVGRLRWIINRVWLLRRSWVTTSCALYLRFVNLTFTVFLVIFLRIELCLLNRFLNGRYIYPIWLVRAILPWKAWSHKHGSSNCINTC